jgi:hypothetical protein
MYLILKGIFKLPDLEALPKIPYKSSTFACLSVVVHKVVHTSCAKLWVLADSRAFAPI